MKKTSNTLRELYRSVRAKCPTMVFLMETRRSKTSCEDLQRQMGFPNGFVVLSFGQKGGLFIFWKGQDHVELVSYSTHYVHLKIVMHGSKAQWWFKGFYGHPETNRRSKSWALMLHLNLGPDHHGRF